MLRAFLVLSLSKFSSTQQQQQFHAPPRGNVNVLPTTTPNIVRISTATVALTNSAALSLEYSADGSIHFPICVVSDQDRFSAVTGKQNTWFSTMLMGKLKLNEYGGTAAVSWYQSQNYTSQMGYQGRGMEFSDLKIFAGTLLTVDDKTGFLYKINGQTATPWVYMADGDGTFPTPFKTEWLTVRDGLIFAGGYGKEMTTTDGVFINDNPMYIKTIDSRGLVTSLSWVEEFKRLREAIQIEFPGYMIHESCQWSAFHQRWFFLPRHASKLTYNADTADDMGANVLLSATDGFDNIQVTRIGNAEPQRGFSAFQFVPGTNDTIIVALKSVEENGSPKESYIMVFGINGRILLDETRLPVPMKFEGIEFYSWRLLLP